MTISPLWRKETNDRIKKVVFGGYLKPAIAVPDEVSGVVNVFDIVLSNPFWAVPFPTY